MGYVLSFWKRVTSVVRGRVTHDASLVLLRYPLLVHHEALRTPGIIPDSASSRKQMRQMPKRRRYARDRPQREHRLCERTLNFGFRFAFSIIDFGGIL